MSERPARLSRADFALFRPTPTRWADNDVYGHVNNVVYYAWFDTAVNAHLIAKDLLDPAGSAVVGLVAETRCVYFESVAFPEIVEIGLAVSRLGRSSVSYRLGVFRRDAELAAAQGLFTHVYVVRDTGRPAPIPEPIRDALSDLIRP